MISKPACFQDSAGHLSGFDCKPALIYCKSAAKRPVSKYAAPFNPFHVNRVMRDLHSREASPARLLGLSFRNELSCTLTDHLGVVSHECHTAKSSELLNTNKGQDRAAQR